MARGDRRAAWASRSTVLKVDLAAIGGSALTDPAIPVPSVKRVRPLAPPAPRRPTSRSATAIFLALAAAWAEANGRPRRS